MTITEVVATIGGTITAMLALYGLDAWRREHTGRRQIELAEDTLALFYEARDVIADVRNPASYGYEHEGLTRGEHEADAEYEARKRASIVFTRLAKHSGVLSRLHAMRYRFMAQIGTSEAQPFEDLRKIVVEIQTAATMLSRLWAREHFRNNEAFEAHRAMVEKFEAIFGWGLPEQDPILPKVDKTISAIEATCRKVINGHGTLFGLLNARLKGSL